MLQDLVKKLEELRERAQKYRDSLSQNEMLTRYVLIDPFLRLWGWDTENPELVRPEFGTQAGRPDYALLADGKPLAFIGAKSLGKQENLEQYISYCVQVGVRYFIATDGVKWEVYDTHLLKPLSEKKIGEWDLLRDNPGEVIRKGFILSRFAPFGLEAARPIISNKGAKEAVLDRGMTLDKLSPKLKVKLSWREIIFPDGDRFSLRHWNDILFYTAKWLIKNNKLARSDCPLKIGERMCILNTEPIHPSGKRFHNPGKINGLYVEKGFNVMDLIKHTRRLLKRAGVDASQVRIV